MNNLSGHVIKNDRLARFGMHVAGRLIAFVKCSDSLDLTIKSCQEVRSPGLIEAQIFINKPCPF